MTLQIGDQAPDFTLYNTEKNQISIADYRGKNIVILFFPMAFTSVCTAELCQTRDDIAYYTGLNAEVFGISVDSIFTLGKFKQDQNLPFHLLSDFNKTTSRAYGSIYENWILGMEGVSKRSAFVIDADGKIVYAEVLESAGDTPNFEAIKAALAAIG
jgi:glutaredoxin-dependent peroxiredoxin